MKAVIARREAMRHLLVLTASFAVPGALTQMGCSKKASCLDVTGLSPDEVRMRQEIAAYAEVAQDPAKKCNACTQWVPGQPDACGGCKVVKGPINAEGSCKLFVAKPA